jgi:hypothetical protein
MPYSPFNWSIGCDDHKFVASVKRKVVDDETSPGSFVMSIAPRIERIRLELHAQNPVDAIRLAERFWPQVAVGRTRAVFSLYSLVVCVDDQSQHSVRISHVNAPNSKEETSWDETRHAMICQFLRL